MNYDIEYFLSLDKDGKIDYLRKHSLILLQYLESNILLRLYFLGYIGYV